MDDGRWTMADGRWRGGCGDGDGEIGSLDFGSSRNFLPKQIREFVNYSLTLLLGMHKKMRKKINLYFIVGTYIIFTISL